MQRTINGEHRMTAVFPRLEVGKWMFEFGPERVTVSVFAGRLIEVDMTNPR
jgi:hypothetical protein